MPIAPAIIAAIIGAATTAVTTGLELTNQPGTPKPTPTPTAPAAPTTPNASQNAAAKLASANTQATAPGASSDYFTQQIASALGLSPSDPVVQSIVNSSGPTSGVGGGSSLTTTPQGNALSSSNPLTDFASKISSSTGNLVDSQLQDSFKGFS